MKILHLLPSLNLYGGTPKKTKNLIEYSSHEHFIYCWSRWESNEVFQESKKKFEDANIKIFDFSGSKNLFNHIIKISRILKNYNISVVQTYFDNGIIIAALIKVLNPNVKVVASFVGPFSEKNPFKNFFINWSIKKMDKLIFISRYVLEERSKIYKGINNVDKEIIPNGTEINPHKKIFKEFTNRKIRLLSISGLVHFKNLKVLINAAKYLKEKTKLNFQITILGEGPLRAELEDLISIYNLQNYFKLPGYESEIEKFLDESDIYLHPADGEGFGIAIVEALMKGMPVVLSNSGALPELIENNISGLLVDPYDGEKWAKKIIYLCENPQVCKKISMNATNHAKEFFHISVFAREHESLYERLIK